MGHRDLPSSAPQGWAEVGPIEAELRRLDDRLRIEWDPEAIMVKRGGYDAQGRIINPVYDGRWKVVIKGDPNRTAMWREDSLLTYVTAQVIIGSGKEKVYAMEANGPYRPIGEWLVEHLRAWDASNREWVKEQRLALDAYNDRQDAATLADAEAGEAEILDEMFFEGTKEAGVSNQFPVAITLSKE